MPRLSTEDRGRAIGLLQSHNSLAAVARTLGCAKSTIARLWTKYRQTGKTRFSNAFTNPNAKFRRNFSIFPEIFLKIGPMHYRRRIVFEVQFQIFQVM